MGKFSELYNSKDVSNEQSHPAREQAKEYLNEFIRFRAITKRQFITLFKKCEEKLKMFYFSNYYYFLLIETI